MATMRHDYDGPDPTPHTSRIMRPVGRTIPPDVPRTPSQQGEPPAREMRRPWDSHDLRFGPEPELLLISRNPTDATIARFRNAPVEFRNVLGEWITVLCFRFGDLPWAMQPWALWETPLNEPDHDLPGEREHPLRLRMILFHPRRGKLAERISEWPVGFSTVIRVAVAGALVRGARPQWAYRELSWMLGEYLDPAAVAASTANALAEAAHEFTYVDDPTARSRTRS